VPLEDTFSLCLKTLLTGLWWWLLERHSPAPHTPYFKKTAPPGVGIADCFGLAALFILVFRWVPGSYLALILDLGPCLPSPRSSLSAPIFSGSGAGFWP